MKKEIFAIPIFEDKDIPTKFACCGSSESVTVSTATSPSSSALLIVRAFL